MLITKPLRAFKINIAVMFNILSYNHLHMNILI